MISKDILTTTPTGGADIYKEAVRYLLVAYFVTTVAGATLSIVLGYALGLPSYVEVGTKPSQSPAYKVTEPFQPLLCLTFYSIFAYRRLRGMAKGELRREAIRLGYVGLIGSILVDYVSFVLLAHPYSFTVREFYLDYQPWITIIYIAIFISPLLVRYGLVQPSANHL